MATRIRILAAVVGVALCAGAHAQVVVDQAAVLAGGITPGDAPGYPATLSATGSYILGSNLSPPASTPAVQISAANVTLDLNGYVVDGGNRCAVPAGGTGSTGNTCSALTRAPFALIESSAARTRIVNGAVVGGAGDGISINSPSSDAMYTGSELRDLRVAHNVGYGVNNGVYASRIRNVSAGMNGEVGLYSQGYGVFDGVKASRNGGEGLQFAATSSGRHFVTTNNGGSGLSAPGTYSLVEATANAFTGIVSGLAANSRASDNLGNGIASNPLTYEVALTNNAQRAYVNTTGCYGRLYVRTTSALTPQVQGGNPLHGSITNCP